MSSSQLSFQNSDAMSESQFSSCTNDDNLNEKEILSLLDGLQDKIKLSKQESAFSKLNTKTTETQSVCINPNLELNSQIKVCNGFFVAKSVNNNLEVPFREDIIKIQTVEPQEYIPQPTHQSQEQYSQILQENNELRMEIKEINNKLESLFDQRENDVQVIDSLRVNMLNLNKQFQKREEEYQNLYELHTNLLQQLPQMFQQMQQQQQQQQQQQSQIHIRTSQDTVKEYLNSYEDQTIKKKDQLKKQKENKPPPIEKEKEKVLVIQKRKENNEEKQIYEELRNFCFKKK